MVEVALQLVGSKLVIDCGSVELKAEEIEARMCQILPVFEQLLEADLAKMSFSEAALKERLPGILSQEMNVDAAIYSTALQAALLLDVISGSEPVIDYNSLELDDE